MKVCLVAEGCYPYVVGGVSGWINSMIKSFPNVEFILLAIVADRSLRGKFVYELPENLTQVYEVYMDDYDWEDDSRKRNKKHHMLSKKERKELLNVVLNQETDWTVIFDMFHDKNFSIDDLLMGADFFEVVRECYKLKYSNIIFSDFLWTMRSMYLPLFMVLKMKVPKADLYHCVATGYAGILGSMAKHFHGSSLLVSEHGIYTREREEELIKARWVKKVYKNIWIEQFQKMSLLTYQKADMVTCLYGHAKQLQIELGCPEEKIRITPNGINTQNLSDLAGKTKEEEQYIYAGAVLRVTPIKDVKTMIQAFDFAKKKVPNMKLFIMGPEDEDKQYAKEFHDMVESLHLKDVIFTGRIMVKDYLGKMDFTLLTSISEGQPLTILESYAAHRPVVATDVGNCRELIYGDGDGLGEAGILTHIMNIEEIAQAMIVLAQNDKLRKQMGENGYQRVMKYYRIEHMKQVYEEIYRKFARDKNLEWTQEPFSIEHTKKREI